MADGLGRSFDALPLASPFGDLDPLGLVLGRFDGAAAACGSDGGAWFIGLGLGVGVRLGAPPWGCSLVLTTDYLVLTT